MTTTRFVRAPELDIPVCRGCGDPGFDGQTWVDTRSGQIFRVPIGEVPPGFFEEGEPDAPHAALDDVPMVLPCGPFPPADEDFRAVDRVSPRSGLFLAGQKKACLGATYPAIIPVIAINHHVPQELRR